MKGRKIIYWLPRILGLAFVLFLSSFALDVFGEYSGWQAVPAFLIHLAPALILLIIVLISWKYDLAGAIAFLGFAVFYVFIVGFARHWSWYLAVSGPSALVGAFFLLSWFQKRNRKSV